jgi:hypothetical protein
MSTEERLNKLEEQMRSMKPVPSSPMREKKKVKREPSEYNNFVKNHINTLKEQARESGAPFAHKDAFKAAAVAWNEQKKARSAE